MVVIPTPFDNLTILVSLPFVPFSEGIEPSDTKGFSKKAPSARKVDASPSRPLFTRGLDGAERCVVTARPSKLMSEGG